MLIYPNASNIRGNTFRFIQLQTRIDCYAKYFFPESVKLWDSLPDSIVSCQETKHSGKILLITITVYNYSL